MKCEARADCKTENAKAVFFCPECNMKYCEDCASLNDYCCDCQEPPRLLYIDKKKRGK